MTGTVRQQEAGVTEDFGVGGTAYRVSSACRFEWELLTQLKELFSK